MGWGSATWARALYKEQEPPPGFCSPWGDNLPAGVAVLGLLAGVVSGALSSIVGNNGCTEPACAHTAAPGHGEQRCPAVVAWR